LRQALSELLGGSPTMAQIGSVGGLLTTIGLLGWAFGDGQVQLKAGGASGGSPERPK
jgi:hypothetical protein